MKEVGTVIAAILLEAGVLLGSVVIGVNMAGGLSPSHSSLDRVPVVGALLPVQADDSQEIDSDSAAKGDFPSGEKELLNSMEFTSDSSMDSLIRELEFARQECESRRKRLERKLREVTAREEQLASDRKALLQDFKSKKKALEKLKEEIEAKRADLESTRVVMKARERENLKDTAKIYERMDAEEAAEILSKVYEKKPETVVKLISLMRDRSAGEIMAEFSEPDTCGEITEKLSHVEEPAQKEG